MPFDTLSPDGLLAMYRTMVTIRKFEDAVNQLYMKAIMPGLAHLYSGEEGVAVGVCSALRPDDYITSTHRGHGHCLAKGAEVHLMFAELLGKVDGYCRGKGGSMHIADQDRYNLGANAIVGGSAGIATGAAFSAKQRKSGQVVAAFFGDGAMGQGVMYEVMNMASIWKLPIIYVCENNLYNEYTPYLEVTSGSLVDRATAFNIPFSDIDGQDVVAVHDAAAAAIQKARRGEGPTFLHCRTYRYAGHHVGDINRSYYRSKEEEAEWREHRDPIRLLADRLLEAGLSRREDLAQIGQEVQKVVDDGAAFAKEAAYPDNSEVTAHVYA